MQIKLRKIALWVAMLLLTWLGVELAAVAAYSLVSRTLFSGNEFKRQIRSSLNTASKLSAAQGNTDLVWANENLVEVIHPYFGFTPDPHRNPQISDFGFYSGEDAHPILKKSPDKIIIGVFGGSFALGTYWAGRQLLKEHFQAIGKEVTVLNFSAGGYKQPQQWLILGYLLSLGAEFDIVINLDGFNEMVLPFAENLPAQVYPFYPRRWEARTTNMIDAGRIKKIGQMEVLREQRAAWAEVFNQYRLYYSPTLCLVWQSRDRLFGRRIYEMRQVLEQNTAAAGNEKTTPQYVSRGPQYDYATEEQLFSDLVAVWRRASFQMKLLCDANQIRYYHFLQPNQYVEGSKPMTEAEKKVALNPGYSYGQGAIKGYPRLRAAGEELVQEGVDFTDLTMIFAQNKERLYVDTCCHLNQQGYQLVTKRMLDIISAPPKHK